MKVKRPISMHEQLLMIHVLTCSHSVLMYLNNQNLFTFNTISLSDFKFSTIYIIAVLTTLQNQNNPNKLATYHTKFQVSQKNLTNYFTILAARQSDIRL